MTMTKNTKRGILILVLVAVLFNLIAFLVPFHKTPVFWIGYGFGMIAILLQLYVFKISFSGDGDAKSKFYGFPIARIGLIYLVVQLIVGFACMAMGAFLPTWVAIILFVIILGAAAIGLITVDAIRDEVERQDTVLKADVTAMRALQSKTASVAAQCQDAPLKKVLTSLAEQFRFSDPVSSDALIDIEENLTGLVEELGNAVLDKDFEAARTLCAKASTLLADRNRMCKLNK